MAIYDTSTLKVVDNSVLEDMIESQIITKLDLAQFSHPDNSLVEQPGMYKIIRKYIGTGDGEVLAMSVGNSQDLGSYFTEKNYRVETFQTRAPWYDEQQMADPVSIDSLVKRMSTAFINRVTNETVREFRKGTNKIYNAVWNYDLIADANSSFPKEDPTPAELFLLISRKDLAAWKKALKDQLKYVEAFVRTGYIGTVDGVNVYYTDGVEQGEAFLATREAVTVFNKKGFEVETERDADHRKTTLFGRKVEVTALTDDDKIIVLLAKADPRAGKTLVASKPSDWATQYNVKYYFYDAEAGTCNLNTEADWDKVQGFIYE